MSEADDRFLESLAVELAPGLGPRLTIVDLGVERPSEGGVRITVEVDSTGGRRLISQQGDSLTEAAAGLLKRAPEVRLADGFREMVEHAPT
jgi:hypothetical protein